MFGVPSSSRIRSISFSAWVISSIDSLRVCLAIRSYPQFSHISACRKYWLMAVNSAFSTSLNTAMTFGSPFTIEPHKLVGWQSSQQSAALKNVRGWEQKTIVGIRLVSNASVEWILGELLGFGYGDCNFCRRRFWSWYCRRCHLGPLQNAMMQTIESNLEAIGDS